MLATPIRLCALLSVALAACGTVRTARVVALEDEPRGTCVRRAAGALEEPVLVTGASGLRTLEVACAFDPPLDEYVQRVVEETLHTELAGVRVAFVGFRPAADDPRRDDFVLEVAIDWGSPGAAAAFPGPHRGSVRGDEDVTAAPGNAPADAGAGILGPRLERLADRRAFEQRVLVRLAAERLARALWKRA
jgi:hypothetical protein